ncbi:trichohyalin-like [Clupea harengus]|uniref:Trichohyalin-like n=1 Tax=Clupea harengus TaxID=7950 RepID=A0A8M1KHW3_CLUHA|nr:trichohyalin-like [Clupea harengus]
MRASQVMAHAEQNEMDISLEERKRQVTKELKEFTREVNKVLDGVSDPDSEESESGNVSVSDEYTTESVWEMDMKAKKARSRQEMDRLKQDKRQRDVERERELERKRELKRLQRAKREQQVVEERGGEQQMNIKAKQKAERQREMAIQQEQELSHDIEKLIQIIQEGSGTDKRLHDMARKELEGLQKAEIYYQNKKRRALERQQTEQLQIQQRQERERRREEERGAAFTRDIEKLVGYEWAGPWGIGQSYGCALGRKTVSVFKTCM